MIAPMKRIALALSLALTACSGSFEESRGALSPTARCAQLDDRHAFWGGFSKFSAALSGASGLATIPITGDTAKVSLGVSGAALAASAVGAAFISESAGTSWARECAKP
jgi:hypothetical protein